MPCSLVLPRGETIARPGPIRSANGRRSCSSPPEPCRSSSGARRPASRPGIKRWMKLSSDCFGVSMAPRSGLSLHRVPMALEVGDQRRAEMAERLLAGIERQITPEQIERFLADAEAAPVGHRADDAGAG